MCFRHGPATASRSVSYNFFAFDHLMIQVEGSCHFAPWELHMYRLVSVVEHFGGGGSGHYSVYRRVSAKNKNDGDHPVVHWFCISDSYVQSVSEKDVLGAEASMLFYEKISE